MVGVGVGDNQPHRHGIQFPQAADGAAGGIVIHPHIHKQGFPLLDDEPHVGSTLQGINPFAHLGKL